MSLKHRRVVTVADQAAAVAAGQLCPSHWGSSSTDYNTAPTHAFDGGALGSLLYRDTVPLEGWSWLPAAAGILACSGAGAVPTWSATPSLTSLTLSTPLGPASGGTGLASYAVGDLLYASGATTLAKLADVAAGSVLASGGVGVAPAWSASPSLTSLTLSSALGVASGGTGLASFTIGDIPIGNGTSALTKLADVATGSVLVSGGVGVAPAWSANPTLTSVVFSGGSVLEGSTTNVIEQRNGTNAQTLRVYNTFTNASNYERGFMRWNANVLEIGSEALGTGSPRNLKLTTTSGSLQLFDGNSTLTVANATLQLGSRAITQLRRIDFDTHNTYDIGQSASLVAPRNIFVGGAVCNRTKAGTPTDSDVTNPADGMTIIDTSGSKIWVRVGGAWKSVAVA